MKRMLIFKEFILTEEEGKSLDVTENYIRIRVKSPDDFEQDSFQWKTISDDKGIHAVMGKIKDSNDMIVQSYAFDKVKWTEDEAKNWVKDHQPRGKGLNATHYDWTYYVGHKDWKFSGDEQRQFEGWASTIEKDRVDDIVLPSAFQSSLADFVQYGKIFYGHKWYEFPIGKPLSATIDPSKGLFIKAQLSDSTEEARTVWKLLKEGILDALSIGFNIKSFEIDPKTNIRTITDLELLETSVVPIPANRGSRIEALKSLEIDNYINQITPEGGMKMLKEFQIRHYDAGDGAGGAAAAKTEEVKHTVEVKVNESFTNMLDRFQAAQKASQAEFNQIIQNGQKDFFEKIDKHFEEQRKKEPIVGAKSMVFGSPVTFGDLKGTKIRDGNEFYAKVLNQNHYGMPDSEKRLMDEFCDLNDLLYTAMWIGKNMELPEFHSKLKENGLYKQYRVMQAEIMKALDTQTSGEGSEFVPVGYSPRLYQKIMLQLRVAALFETIPMPTAVLKLPTDMAEDMAYYIPENTGDVGTLVRAITSASSQATLTAKKLGARTVLSNEMIEDGVFAILPWVNSKLVRAMARAIENATLNGDTAGSMDSDISAGYDCRLAFSGMRKLCNASGKTDFSSVTFPNAGDKIRGLRANMGEYGVDPTQLYHVIGLKTFVNLLGVKDSGGYPIVSTIEKWGPAATFATGTLAVFDGAGIIVSPFAREDVNASGVYDGSTKTKTNYTIVNRLGFVNGERRIARLASREDIDVDQQVMVVTARRAFTNVTGTSLNPVAMGYGLAW